jgi:hypothetical protein
VPHAVESRMGEANDDGDKPAAARHPKYRSEGTGDAADIGPSVDPLGWSRKNENWPTSVR